MSSDSHAVGFLDGQGAVLPKTAFGAQKMMQDSATRLLMQLASAQIVVEEIKRALQEGKPGVSIDLGASQYIPPDNPQYQAIKNALLRLEYVQKVYLRENVYGGAYGTSKNATEKSWFYGRIGGRYYLEINFDPHKSGRLGRGLLGLVKDYFSRRKDAPVLSLSGEPDKLVRDRIAANLDQGLLQVQENAAAFNIDPKALCEAVSSIKEVIADPDFIHVRQLQKSGVLIADLGQTFRKARARIPDSHINADSLSQLRGAYDAAVSHLQRATEEVRDGAARAAVSELEIDCAVLALQFGER